MHNFGICLSHNRQLCTVCTLALIKFFCELFSVVFEAVFVLIRKEANVTQ